MKISINMLSPMAGVSVLRLRLSYTYTRPDSRAAGYAGDTSKISILITRTCTRYMRYMRTGCYKTNTPCRWVHVLCWRSMRIYLFLAKTRIPHCAARGCPSREAERGIIHMLQRVECISSHRGQKKLGRNNIISSVGAPRSQRKH